MIMPRIELGTFCVLSRCHNQLDHGTEVLDDSSGTAGDYVGTLIVPGRIGSHFEGRGRKWGERLASTEAQSLEPSLRLWASMKTKYRTAGFNGRIRNESDGW